MVRCRTCVMPNTRPDTPFIDGECSACVSYKRRPAIDWDARKAELIALLDRHDGRCIVPSSGGKDSTCQVKTLLELGADVTVVTATTCHLTPVGRANINNLACYAKTIEVSPNKTVRAKLNRLGLELVGDISWPEHCAIFSTPFNVALDMRIGLMFYGENPQDQYGGPLGSEAAKQLTMRWRSEFGGFLGLRPADFIGMDGITERDMEDYMVRTDQQHPIEAHFLGQYLPWDSRANVHFAESLGMMVMLPTPANWLAGENMDNAQTGIHDYFMFRKYGFGRGCQQISADVRAGRVSRAHAAVWIDEYDGRAPLEYAGVSLHEVLDRIGVAPDRLWKLADEFSAR